MNYNAVLISVMLLQCITCKDTFDDYTSDIIKGFEVNFGDIEECQVFLTNYRKNPNSNFDQCAHCLRSKWRKIHESGKKRPMKNVEIKHSESNYFFIFTFYFDVRQMYYNFF